MKFYSTNNKGHLVGLKTAVLQSLPRDRGLYMPEQIIGPGSDIIAQIEKYTFSEIAYRIALPYLHSDFRSDKIKEIVTKAVNFSAPLVTLSDHLSILELWHGPSLAFKDFGARFMAGVMSELIADENGKLTILVATSGDTGGAVASGFYGKENIDVFILFPKGKVSPLQEKQLTCHGGNIKAIEIGGTFDDCQSLVKTAFLDSDINQRYRLSSANSINIARLLPQSFYYFEAYKQLIINDLLKSKGITFCIPSGNFGNLTAGLMARKMGLPVDHFIAATNLNDVVPRYLSTGVYHPKPSIQTISNAMDVGNPSNFSRILDLFDNDWLTINKSISGYSYDDDKTRDAIAEIQSKHDYIMDPHGAVGYLAACEHLSQHSDNHIVALETAHPAKFLPVMESIVGTVEIPLALKQIDEGLRSVVTMSSSFEDFKSWMLAR